jgi:hypothetical protein
LVIWLGYDDGTVSVSEDNGIQFDDIDDDGTNPPPDGPVGKMVVTDIAANPNVATEALVSIGGTGTTRGVWLARKLRGEWTWQRRMGSGDTALPPIQVNTVRYNPLNTNWIYAGTDIGVFASEDKGITWNRTPRFEDVDHDGPVNTIVEDLFFQDPDHLVAVTHGRGMFRSRVAIQLFVDSRNEGPFDGSEERPFPTIGLGHATAGNGTTLVIEGGEYAEGPLHLTKRLHIQTRNGTVLIR